MKLDDACVGGEVLTLSIEKSTIDAGIDFVSSCIVSK